MVLMDRYEVQSISGSLRGSSSPEREAPLAEFRVWRGLLQRYSLTAEMSIFCREYRLFPIGS
jgi:hypothetical protein